MPQSYWTTVTQIFLKIVTKISFNNSTNPEPRKKIQLFENDGGSILKG